MPAIARMARSYRSTPLLRRFASKLAPTGTGKALAALLRKKMKIFCIYHCKVCLAVSS
jgi:hypothetical protein